MGGTKGNDHRNIQSHNKTHTRVRFHHMVTTSIRHKHQQTTDNTKHRIQNSNWVHNRHKHTTSTRRNTHSTHKVHLQLHASQIRQKSQHPTHPLHYITTPRRKKQTTYNNTDYTTDIDTNPNTIDTTKIKTNKKHIRTTIVSTYLNNRQHNKVTNTIPITVHHSETTLPRATRRTMAQLRTNKCLLLRSYLNKIDDPSPLCPLYKTEPHTTHLFNCTNINTKLQVTDLWTATVEVGHLLVEQRGATSQLAGPDSGQMGVGWYHRLVCVETVVGPLHHSENTKFRFQIMKNCCNSHLLCIGENTIQIFIYFVGKLLRRI